MDLGDRTEDSTLDFMFSTRNVSAAPATLAGTPIISIYKANGTTQSVAGVTLTVDFDGVTGLNHVRLVTTDAFYAAANDYIAIITTGTVNSVSVVGTTIATFSIENRFMRGTDNAATAAALVVVGLNVLALQGTGFVTGTDSNEAIRNRGDAAWTTGSGGTDWTSGEREEIRGRLGVTGTTAAGGNTPTLSLQTTVDGIPTTAEFEARTLVAANYFDPAADAVANVTLVATLTTYTGDTPQTADHTAAIADIPTVSEFNARTIPSADYFDPAADTVATVTTVTDGAKATAIAALNDITAQDVLDAGDIDGFSLEEAQKLILAVNAGVLAGAATSSMTMEAADGSKIRITATTDVDGNRTTVIKDATG